MSVRHLARNFSAVTLMRLLAILVSFPFYAFLARRWEAEGFGAFAVLWAFFMIGRELVLMGLHFPAMREIAQQPRELPRLASNLTTIGLAFSVLTCIAFGWAGIVLYPTSLHAAFWLMGAALIPTAVASVAETVLIAEERIIEVSVLGTIEMVARIAIWIVAVLNGYGIAALFLILLLTRIAAVMGFLVILNIRDYLQPGLVSRAGVYRLLTLAPVFLGIVLLQSCIHRIDFVFLSQLGSLEQTGFYAAPYKLIEGLVMLPSILTLVVYPTISRAFATSQESLEEVVCGLIRFTLLVGLPVIVLLGFAGEPLLSFLFGPEFGAAAPALAWLAIVPVSTAVAQTLGTALQASHRQDLDLRSMFLTLSFYVLALLILIPPFGFIGAAAATACADLVQTTVRYFLLRRSVGVSGILAAGMKPVAAAGAMTIIILLLPGLRAPLAMSVGVAAYGFAVVLTGAVTARDADIVRSVLGKRQPA